MVTTAAARRLDRRRHRGRGAAARVHLDQGVRPALQRQVPRRQELPVPRGDAGRGVPAGAGHARREAQGRALLRAVLARLGDPRDRRPAAAGLPDAHLQHRGLPARRPDRPALPARLHRQVLGAVRRPGRRRGAPADRRGLLRLHGRPDRALHPAARGARCAPRPTRRSTSGPPGCATTSARCGGRWRSNAVVLGDGTDADVVALAEDQLEAAVQVFHVRGGRVRGQRGWVVEKVEELDTGDLVEQLLLQLYGGECRRRGARARCSCPALPADADGGDRVAGRPARRPGRPAGAAARRQAGADGDGRAQRRAVAGAAQDPARRRPDRAQPGAAGDAGRRSGWTQAPLRIECFDVSNLQGTDVVASMVVFEDGLARKSEYRRFADPRRPPTGSRRRRARSTRSSPAGSGATSTSARRPPTSSWRSAPPTTPAGCRGSTRTPAGRASSPTRPTCVRRRRRAAAGRGGPGGARRARHRRRRASPASPSGWRRSGCPAGPTR